MKYNTAAVGSHSSVVENRNADKDFIAAVSNTSLGRHHVLFSEQTRFHVLLSLCLMQGT